MQAHFLVYNTQNVWTCTHVILLPKLRWLTTLKTFRSSGRRLCQCVYIGQRVTASACRPAAKAKFAMVTINLNMQPKGNQEATEDNHWQLERQPLAAKGNHWQRAIQAGRMNAVGTCREGHIIRGKASGRAEHISRPV